MKEKVLKNYNTELNMLLLVNILLFIMLGFGLDYMADKSNIIKLLVMIVVPGIPSLLVTNFISVDLKEDLILDKKYEEEPILTLLKKEDKNNEIDFHLIELEYGKYSEDKDEQKKIWYRIYRKHEYNPRVTQVNRQYLMTRVFIFILLPLMPITVLFCIFSKNINFDIIFWWFILIIGEIFVFTLMANEFYNRVSKNPLLEETYHLRKKHSLKDDYCFTYA